LINLAGWRPAPLRAGHTARSGRIRSHGWRESTHPPGSVPLWVMAERRAGRSSANSRGELLARTFVVRRLPFKRAVPEVSPEVDWPVTKPNYGCTPPDEGLDTGRIPIPDEGPMPVPPAKRSSHCVR